MIDINVWLALTWDKHPQHIPASRWYASIDDAALLFCRLTMLGFLRLLTNRKVMGGSTTTLAGALQLYDRWTGDPRVELAPEPRGAETLFRQATGPFALQPATKAIADCYLVGFAEAAGAHVVTFDRGLAATARFRQVPVALLEPAQRADSIAPSTRPGRRGRRSQ
ncbi:MAG: TA system VapC family ribonuclease toxin [Bryobacteraceae bacterium]